MKTNNQFDAIAYFTKLTRENRLCAEHGFHPCTCSGPQSIEGVRDSFGKYSNFVMIDDTTSQNTYSRGVTFFDRNAYTVFVVAAYKWDDMADRERALNLCRRIFRQFHSRLIRDRDMELGGDALQFLEVDQVYSKEFPRFAFPNLTGLYFMLNNDEPVDLTYDESEWQSVKE